MSEVITYPKPSGASYLIPDVGDVNWGQNVTDFLVAIPNGTVPTSGTFTLTGDLSWGTSFGLLSKYFTSLTANPASAGVLRLAKTDAVEWRNNGGGGNLALAINGSDQLTFNGTVIQTILSLGNLTDAGTDGIVVTNGTGAVIGSGTSLAQHVADASHNGYLSSTDWSTFNAKGSGTVTSVSGTANQITSTGGTTPVLAIASPLTTPGALTATGDISAGTHSLIAGTASIGGSGVTGSVILVNVIPHSVTVTIPVGVFTDYSLILPNSVGSSGQVLTASVSGSTNTLGWSTPVSGTVTSVSGTSNQITSTGGATPVLALASPLTTPAAATITGQLTISNGSVGTPGIAFANSSNTGFYSTATGNIAITSQGVNYGGFSGNTNLAWVSHGTNTNDNAAAGYVGEYIESIIASGSAVSLSTGTAKSVTSISLTAGDWDVFGMTGFVMSAASMSLYLTGSSIVNNTIGAESFTAVSQTVNTADFRPVWPSARLSLSGTTIVYLVAQATFTGTVSAFGRISARRVR